MGRIKFPGIAAALVIVAGGLFYFFKMDTAPAPGSELTLEQARAALDRMVEQIDPVIEGDIGRVNMADEPTTSFDDTLPEITQYPLAVDPVTGANDIAVEIFSSTEKSGEGTDGWIVAVAEAFNKRNVRLSTGRTAKIKIRYIPSGTAYWFIAGGKYLPEAFSPSNQLWIRMLQAGRSKSLPPVEMTPIRESLVRNVAGVVMKTETADSLKTDSDTLDVRRLIYSVAENKIVMGYTDPFASSTGLNFLVTVLQTFAEGDNNRLLEGAVQNSFTEFQHKIPFVVHTTIQMRSSVAQGGSLDAFVMEYQTFANEPALKFGYEFIPFGARHDNPLYAIGSPTDEVREALEAFADMAKEPEFLELARKYGFDAQIPLTKDYKAPYALPHGRMIVAAQKLWKEKKDSRVPLGMLLFDVSGSMTSGKIGKVQDAIKKASAFIKEDTVLGMATFADTVSILLQPRPFDLNQKASLFKAVEVIDPKGNTAMYDGIAVALSKLLEAKDKNPELRPRLFVLTDGETNRGRKFDELKRIVEAVGIPVHTIGFEADLKELERLSLLVESANLNAEQGNIAHELGKLFNAEL